MAEASWPFYGTETNETQFSKWARSLADSGIVSGLALTTPGGMVVRIAAGQGLVRGVFYENDANKDLTVGAAPGTAGQTRLDAIVLRLDQTANSIIAAVKAGTANTSGGALPALTQNETTYELLIGTVSVASGVAAITAGMLTELRPSTGERVGVGPSSRQPTAAAYGEGLWFDTTTKQIEYSDGSTWLNLFTTDNITGVLAIAKGGTGVQTYKALREALDIYVQPSAPSHKAGRLWIPATPLA
jgi:hypothetical protein